MWRIRGGARVGSPGCRAVLGAALGAALIATASSACRTGAPPRTSPAGSEAISLPGFRVSLPSRRGWRGEADRPSRTASLMKKYSGFFREWLESEAYADISIKPLFVPPVLWAANGEELLTALKNDYAWKAGLGSEAVWKRRSIRGRRADYTTGKEIIALSSEEIDLWATTDVSVIRRVLRGLYFPPDLERAHRYVEILVEITELNYLPLINIGLGLSLLDAVVESLEIVGPFDHLPEPTGGLARAVLARDAEAARKAVEDGADADAGLPDWTPFEMAAFGDRRDLAGILDRNGGLAAVFDDQTALRPFLLALIADLPDIAAFLLDQGAAGETGPPDGPPPLALAAGLGYVEIVTELLERGADVDVRTRDGWTPLILACESGAADCAEALMAGGADPDLRTESGGAALHAAVDWGRPEIMRSLLAYGADVDIRDNNGWSCLHVAIFHGDTGIVGEFIAAGADVNARVDDGRTALSMAQAGGHAAIAELLLKAGAKR